MYAHLVTDGVVATPTLDADPGADAPPSPAENEE
jgi:hypothetical protein